MRRYLFPGRALGVMVIVSAVVAISCSAFEAPRPSGPKGPPKQLAVPPGSTGAVPIWTSAELRPIAQPVAAGYLVVGAIVDKRQLFLIAMDPASGIELWRKPMARGETTPGVDITIPVLDGKVAYIRPADIDPTLYRLIIADVQTGEDLAMSPPVRFDSSPFLCHGGHSICALSHGVDGGRVRQYRLNLTTGDYVKASVPLPPQIRQLDVPSLLDLGDRPSNTIGWLDEGKLIWRMPVSAAFPDVSSTDHGWSLRLFADQHVVVGTVFDGSSVGEGDGATADLSHAMTVGIAEQTGKVLWNDRGSRFQCNLGHSEFPVRCRVRGSMVSKADEPRTFDGLDIAVEGFAPLTGQTTWSVPVGAESALVDARIGIPIAGPSQAVLSGPSGPIVVDYATGTTTQPPANATFWCLAHTWYDLLPAYYIQTVRHYTRAGGQLATVCDAQGRPAKLLPSTESTLGVGTRVGDFVVLAGQHGYVGFQIQQAQPTSPAQQDQPDQQTPPAPQTPPAQ